MSICIRGLLMGCNSNGSKGKKKKIPEHDEDLIVFYEEASSLMPQLRSLSAPRELKKSVTNNRRLLCLAMEYMMIVIATLKLIAAMKLSLSVAQDRQAIVLQAINCFETGKYSLTISKLSEFRDAGNPFAAPFTDEHEFSSLRERRQSIAERLAGEKDEIKGLLSSMKIWRKVRKAMCDVAFASVLVLSVALAAVSVPAFATVAASAGGTAIRTAEQWLDSACDERLDAVKGEGDAVLMMVKGVSGIHELDGDRDMVKRLETMMGWIWGDAAFAVNHGDQEIAFVMAMEEIKRKVGVIQEWVGELKMKMDDWDEVVRKAVTEFLMVMSADS